MAGSVSGVSGTSGMSSLGQSEVSVSVMTQSLRRRLNTRQRLVSSDGHDSDDDNTDGEDLYEVDHAQNFWQSPQELQQMIRDEIVDADEDDGDVADVVPTGIQPDYGVALRDCSEFQFEEVIGGQANNMAPPEKIYDAPSGLRKGVAHSFTLPLLPFPKGTPTVPCIMALSPQVGMDTRATPSPWTYSPILLCLTGGLRSPALTPSVLQKWTPSSWNLPTSASRQGQGVRKHFLNWTKTH
jgi:hypothetical protein